MSNEGNFTVDPKKPLILGVIGGLAGIYLVPINPILGPLFAAIGAVAAVIWGAEVVARVGSYGLGTGIPSIGYMALAIAIIGVLGGLSGSVFFGNIVWMGPLIGFILSMIVGGIAAILVTRVLKLKDPFYLDVQLNCPVHQHYQYLDLQLQLLEVTQCRLYWKKWFILGL